MMDIEYLDIICCPQCKGNLELEDNRLRCNDCNGSFKITKGIPILLPKSLQKDLTLTQNKWDLRHEKESKSLSIDIFSQPYLRDSYKYIREYGITAEKYCLEIGCGSAKNSALLAKDTRAKVIGIDISLQACLNARELFDRHGIDGFFVCGDCLNMPFKNNVFNFTFGLGVIEHFRDTQKAVNELTRCLAPKGLISVTVPYISLSTLTYGQLSGNIPDLPVVGSVLEWFHLNVMRGKLMMYGYEKSFTKRKLIKVFENAGLKNIELGLFETYYEIKFFKSRAMKKLLRKLAVNRFFWPMVYVNGRKLE